MGPSRDTLFDPFASPPLMILLGIVMMLAVNPHIQ